MKIKSYYEKTGKERPEKRKGGIKKREIPLCDVIKDYESGLTQKEVAIKYGLSQAIVHKRIDEYYKNTGKERRKKIQRKHRDRIDLPIDEIVYDYENGVNVNFLARKYGISVSLMYSRIAEYRKEKGEQYQKDKERETKKSTDNNDINEKINVLVQQYCDKGLTPDQIMKIANQKYNSAFCQLIEAALKNIKSKKDIRNDEAR